MGDTLLIVTVMAYKTVSSAVYREPRVTVVAFSGPTTMVTDDGRSKSAAIEKYQYLMTIFNSLPNGCKSRHGNAGDTLLTFEINQ